MCLRVGAGMRWQRTAPGPLRYHFKPSHVFPSVCGEHLAASPVSAVGAGPQRRRAGRSGGVAAKCSAPCPLCFRFLPLGGRQAHPAGAPGEGGGEPACALGPPGAGPGGRGLDEAGPGGAAAAGEGAGGGAAGAVEVRGGNRVGWTLPASALVLGAHRSLRGGLSLKHLSLVMYPSFTRSAPLLGPGLWRCLL